jgi:hypothetical protein
VIIGGGYNRRDLTDMWAYDTGADRWLKLPGEVPTGFYLTADLAPERRLIVLVANTRAPGDRAGCNALYPVRTTYEYRIDTETLKREAVPATKAELAMPKRPPAPPGDSAALGEAQAARLGALPPNQWTPLAGPGRTAPMRTWGSATFDGGRGWILYWGGGHCGYGGNDVDAYDVAANTWRAVEASPEFPHRAWDKGVRLAGVTFQGGPWTDHGRRIYAHDPVSRRMVMMRTIRLTTGYDAEALRGYPEKRSALEDALVGEPSSYVIYATFTYDPGSAKWELAGPAPAGMDTLVATPHGVMGINVDWPSRLNDAGYLLPWRPTMKPRDTAVHLFDAGRKRWNRLDSPQPSPQNLYELTALACDTRRDRLVLHGAGARQDELWTFDFASRRWSNMRPKGVAPVCAREAVYLPRQDVFLTLEAGSGAALWAWSPAGNAWRRVEIPAVARGQNRAMVYDAGRDVVLLVAGAGGDAGLAAVYALRFR